MVFTLLAFAGLIAIGFAASRSNRRDDREAATVHTRQDVRLIVWLLAAILLMLGVIADGAG